MTDGAAPDPAALLDLAVRAAEAAGALLLDHAARAPVGIATKSSATDMVSDADRAAERLLLEQLHAERPDDAILGEEGTNRAGRSGLTWVVDPLDGTTNFLYGYPQWAVSVCCEDENGQLVGCVHDPNRGETFSAVRGGGARRDGVAIQVTALADLGQALIGTGFNYDPVVRAGQAAALAAVLPAVRDVRRGGSAALDLAWTACGRLDGYWEAGLQRWDWAAGVLLVREAGGVVSSGPTAHGRDGHVASGPDLHDDLLVLVG